MHHWGCVWVRVKIEERRVEMAVSSLLTLQSPLSISAPTTAECLPSKAVGTPLLGCPPAAEWLRYMIPLQRAVEDASPYNRRMSAVKGRRGELCSPAVAAEYVPVKNVGTPVLGCPQAALTTATRIRTPQEGCPYANPTVAPDLYQPLQPWNICR